MAKLTARRKRNRSEQFERPATCDRLCPAGDAQLSENVINVPFDCADLDVQPGRDLGIRQSIGDQTQHFQFAFTERLDQRLTFGC
jgi:hypothetical protein